MAKKPNVSGDPHDTATIQFDCPLWLKQAAVKAAEREGLELTPWMRQVTRAAAKAKPPRK